MSINPVYAKQSLKRFDDAAEYARQVQNTGGCVVTKGDRDVGRDEENGWGIIIYYHLEDDEFI